MIKEWVTVISWREGKALLLRSQKIRCSGCGMSASCSPSALLVTEADRKFQVSINQPLKPGQRLELGISENRLLCSAILVYLAPILGVTLGGGLSQYFLGTDTSAAIGALMGGGAVFSLINKLSHTFIKQAKYRPIILQICAHGKCSDDLRFTSNHYLHKGSKPHKHR